MTETFMKTRQYLLHPKRIEALIDSRDAWRDAWFERNEELYREAIVQNLRDELNGRKKELDEIEALHDQDMQELLKKLDDLRAEIASTDAVNANLRAKIAGLQAENAYLRANEVQPKKTPTTG